MGTNLPGYNPDAINWLEAHIDAWANDPAAIGLTDQQVADVADYLTTARMAATDANAQHTAAQVATTAAKDRADAMRLFAAPLIANIKHFAENSANPSAVYTAAGILQRKTPAPSPAPARPTDIKLSLNTDGAVAVTFEAVGPVGTTWSVKRKLASETAFTQVGFAAPSPKIFTDRTVSMGEESVTYCVQGVRGGKLGPVSSMITLPFGSKPRVASDAASTAKAA